MKQEDLEAYQGREVDMRQTINADKEHISTLQSDIASLKSELSVATTLCKQFDTRAKSDKKRLDESSQTLKLKDTQILTLAQQNQTLKSDFESLKSEMHRKYENISNMYQLRLAEVKEMHVNDSKEMAELKQ